MAIIFTVHRHWVVYQAGETTRGQMVRDTTLDLIGLALTMGAAIFVGRLAGGYFGVLAGFWIGILAGFAGGFFAAWVVRSVWGRLVRVGV